MLAVASTEQPADTVLREHGVTPERVEEEIARRAGPPCSATSAGTR